MNRRRFLKTGAAAGLSGSSGLGPTMRRLYAFGQTPNLSHVEARYYKKLPDLGANLRPPSGHGGNIGGGGG